LSRLAKTVVYNSELSASQHESIGYSPRKRRLIFNGFDLQRWHGRNGAAPPVPLDRLQDRQTVGRFGRYAAMKDHATFLEAAALIVKQMPGVSFVLAGTQVDDSNKELTSQIERLGLGSQVHLLGERDDLPALTSYLDVAVSSSAFGEGFPNVVGEALACGVPVVATDVGDTGAVLGDGGTLVPARDAEALAAACLAMLRLSPSERRAIGQRGRERVTQHFSLETVVQQFEGLLA